MALHGVVVALHVEVTLELFRGVGSGITWRSGNGIIWECQWHYMEECQWHYME